MVKRVLRRFSVVLRVVDSTLSRVGLFQQDRMTTSRLMTISLHETECGHPLESRCPIRKREEVGGHNDRHCLQTLADAVAVGIDEAVGKNGLSAFRGKADIE